MAKLIDSSTLVGMERRGLRPAALPHVMPGAEELALAAVTVSELLLGLHRADTPARRVRRENFVEALLETIPVLPFDLRTARVYGRVWADLAATGQMIGAHDAQVAATGLAYGYGVLTDNPKHFQRVPGLDVTAPTWPA